MNYLLVLIASVSVLIGLVCGGLIVFLLFAVRKKILANSLTHTRTLVGHIGTVQMPFDHDTKGKVRVSVENSTKELIAFTDYPHTFNQGDQVVIVQIKDTRAWVVPGNIFDDR